MASIIVNRHGIMAIDFWYQCKRHRYSTDLPDTKPNRLKATRIKQAIEYDISNNKLDIARYFQNIKADGSKADTLSDFFDYYIKEKSIRPSSWKNLHSIWERHLKPYFGHWHLQDINRHEILVFRNTLIGRELAPSTINLIMVHLASILSRAHDEGRIKTYPMRKMGHLDPGEDKIDPFSFDELNHLLGFLAKKKPEYYPLVSIWAACGPRRGEILGLKWEDLDYFNATLSINRTLHPKGTEGPPKTKYSRRTIPLRPEVIADFKRQEKYSRLASEYIFTDPLTNKRYKAADIIIDRFKVILRLAGLRYRSPNQLRHTFASLAIGSGESILWVSMMMGHKSSKPTLERYARYIPNLARNDGGAYQANLKKSLFSDPLVTQDVSS